LLVKPSCDAIFDAVRRSEFLEIPIGIKAAPFEFQTDADAVFEPLADIAGPTDSVPSQNPEFRQKPRIYLPRNPLHHKGRTAWYRLNSDKFA
jgi:hypothetical protein